MADNTLEITNHFGERVRTHHGTNGIKRVHRILQILFKCTVDCILKGSGTATNRHQRTAQNFHLGHIRVFLFNVDFTHVDLTLDTHQRTRGCQRNAMLPRARLCEHLGLAHMLG